MPNFWLSWYGPTIPSPFELHSPWWTSGWRCADDAPTIVAAVRADDEAAAWAQVRASYDVDPGELEQRFIEPLIVSPFTDRFPQAAWMAWDDDRTCACGDCAEQGDPTNG